MNEDNILVIEYFHKGEIPQKYVSLEEYVDILKSNKKLQEENEKLKSVVILASEACCYTEYEDACFLSKQVLKELENK